MLSNRYCEEGTERPRHSSSAGLAVSMKGGSFGRDAQYLTQAVNV
jgi:hypothetical protein